MHRLSLCKELPRAFVSVNRLRNRKSDFIANDWIMDSGAFTEISTYGTYRYSYYEYVDQIERWRACGNMLAAVSQDWMCEPFIVGKTGLNVREHQLRTIHRYAQIRSATTQYIMPVLQGYIVEDYLSHIEQYGKLLRQGAWVGVGSICKRNTKIEAIEYILGAIKKLRPDLRLHGFGLKVTALRSAFVRSCLYSADSMAWSFHARKHGRDGNSLREALEFVGKIEQYDIKRQQEPNLWGNA
jgi:hypothetical protein